LLYEYKATEKLATISKILSIKLIGWVKIEVEIPTNKAINT